MPQQPTIDDVKNLAIALKYKPKSVARDGNNFTVFVQSNRGVTKPMLTKRFAGTGYEVRGAGWWQVSGNWFVLTWVGR